MAQRRGLELGEAQKIGKTLGVVDWGGPKPGKPQGIGTPGGPKDCKTLLLEPGETQNLAKRKVLEPPSAPDFVKYCFLELG